MDFLRWMRLEDNGGPLTDEEITEGWHYCPDWDQMLIGPGMIETESCLCEKRAKSEG